MGLYETSCRFGLRRDLSKPLQTPVAKIPITVRPATADDMEALFSDAAAAGNPEEQSQLAWRRDFAIIVGKGCFVAIDSRDGTPCYAQWLFSSSENPAIARVGGFPPLALDEALLENAYTPVNYRGQRIMSAAMAMIAERAADFGARYVMTYVRDSNIASLKGCVRAGFYPHLLHTQVRACFGLIKKDTYEVLPEDDPRRTMTF